MQEDAQHSLDALTAPSLSLKPSWACALYTLFPWHGPHRGDQLIPFCLAKSCVLDPTLDLGQAKMVGHLMLMNILRSLVSNWGALWGTEGLASMQGTPKSQGPSALRCLAVQGPNKPPHPPSLPVPWTLVSSRSRHTCSQVSSFQHLQRHAGGETGRGGERCR